MLPNLYKKTSKDAVWGGTTKTAGSEVILSDKTENWPKEIIQDVYKQLPYTADFHPEVVMDRVDAERGYAFGNVHITNKTQLGSSSSSNQEQAAGIGHVRVPIIVKDKKLQPLDVMVTAGSKMKPMTESRLREELFRPQPFDTTAETPGDTSLISQLYPPYRQNFGFGNTSSVTGEMGLGKSAEDASAPTPTQDLFAKRLKHIVGISDEQVKQLKDSSVNLPENQPPAPGLKLAATGVPNSTVGSRDLTRIMKQTLKMKTASMVREILPTIDGEHLNRFWDTVLQPQIKVAFRVNGANASKVLNYLADCETLSGVKLANQRDFAITPDVMQITKVGSAYQVKTARHDFWDPISDLMSKKDLVYMYGEKIAREVDSTGSVTIAAGASAAIPEDEKKEELVSKFGMYRVKDVNGDDVLGIVFPRLFDFSGNESPICLFTNGKQTAIQSEIMGTPAGNVTSLPTGKPVKGGNGLFYFYTKDGEIKATVPVKINGLVQGPEDSKLFVELWDGSSRFITFSGHVKTVVCLGEDECLIPSDASWMPLERDEPLALADGKLTKKAAVRSLLTLNIHAGEDGMLSLTGPAMDKFGSSSRMMMDFDDAMFILGGFGVNFQDAMTKIGQSIHEQRPVPVGISRTIKLAAMAEHEARNRAKTKLAGFPNLRVELWKEAAFIPDPTAVDTLLSIGFINPENIATFVSYLPNLEEAQEKLCELLVATRLGLKDIPLEALERAVKSLEKTIEGLKLIAFQSLD